ncbi:MAG: hypothetical protein VX747_00410, partial [Actinomycetota bacterium]|nr:hypothetical protein [Actinomycetota bacterium]
MTDRNVTITVTDDGTNTGTADSADHKVDTVDPAPTQANIATDGANGDDGSFVDTDVVRAVWDNSAATGDNQTDLAASDPVSVDFSEFGGDAAVVAVDDGSTPVAGCTDDASGDDKWTACADVDGAREVADANVVVTTTDDAGNTGAADGADQDVDTIAPTVTAGNITVTNATDDGAPFQDGDVAKIEWDDSAGGDNNADTLSARTVDLSDFGGAASVNLADDDGNDSGACTDTAAGDGKWTACVTLGGTIDVTDAVATVSATDDAGNVTTTSSADQVVDTVDPAPTQANIALSGQGGTNDTFVTGDTVTVVWDASAATGDDIADVDSVAVDLSEFGGGAAVAAVDDGTGQDVAADDDKWTASAALNLPGEDLTDRNVTLTVTDNA